MRFLSTLLALSLLLTGCAGKYRVVDTFYEDVVVDFPLAEAVAYNLAKIVAESKENNFNIELCHSRAYRKIDGSFLIVANFYSMENLEINESRHAMANLVADILLRVNDDETIMDFTGGMPFAVANLRISIDYESFFGRFVDPRLVGRTELKFGYLTAYYAHSALDADSVIFQQFFEPFITTAMITKVDARVAEEMEWERDAERSLLDVLQQDQEKYRTGPPPPAPIPDRVEYEDNGRTNYYPQSPPPPPPVSKKKQRSEVPPPPPPQAFESTTFDDECRPSLTDFSGKRGKTRR